MSNFRRRHKSRRSDDSNDSSDSCTRSSSTPSTCRPISLNMIRIQNMILEAANLLRSLKKEFNQKVGIIKEESKFQQKFIDNDHRKPQYIPEHNDPDSSAAESREVKEKKNKSIRKDTDIRDRWPHDKYNEEEQAPKSRAEIIAEYGYDIRAEKKPPRASKRRRYNSWGSNNYTRNWEDEDAHRKKKYKTDRWNHDQYNDKEQAPKSDTELMSEYGYDIRKRVEPSKEEDMELGSE